MDIVKRLTLNRTPKDIPNRSLVCAKNMMIDDTGSFLTNDIGFKEAVNLEGEYIVGVIPCSSEIVILTEEDAGVDYHESHIYRKQDKVNTLEEVLCSWRYSGGKISGTYTYNYKGELVLVIAESGASTDVPLKSFIIHENLDNATSTQYPYVAEADQTYGIEENIPHHCSSYYITYNGNLVCGVYTFFIRFNIDDYNRTKWFQISSDIIINHEILSKKYIHWYLGTDDRPTSPEEGPTFNVSSDGMSNKAIVLDIELGDTVFKEFEIGYIIKRKGDIQGRLHGCYTIGSNNVVTISSNNYLEEISVDDLLENPHQLFNVGSVVNYNNRLYLTNYKEYDVVDYSNYASQIHVSVDEGNVTLDPGANISPGYRKVDLDIVVKQTAHKGAGSSNIFTKTDTIHIYNLLLDEDGKVMTKEQVLSPFTSILFLYALDLGLRFYLDGRYVDLTGTNTFDGSYFNLYWFLQNPNNYNDAICIFDYIGNSNHTPTAAGWGWNFTVPTYDIYLKSDNNLYVKVNDAEYQLTGEGACISCILGHRNDTLHDYFYFGEGYGDITLNPLIVPGQKMPSVISGTISSAYDGGQGGSGDEGEQQGGINIENGGVNTRTLMPKQQYNFFIHYLRKDGSCTPGYRIGAATFDVNNIGELLIPIFDSIYRPSSEFEGFFISYEDVERNCDCVYITYNDSGIVRITNAAYMYDLDTPRASAIYVGGTRYILSSDLITYVENRLLYNHMKVIDSRYSQEKVVAFITEQIQNQYKNKEKVLYRLTRNIYEWSDDDTEDYVLRIGDKDYLPDFYNKQVFITYKDKNGYIINPGTSYVFEMDSLTAANNGKKTTYDVDIFVAKLYSKYPTEAMNVKEDFSEVANVLQYKENNESKSDIYINSVVGPDKLHDYLELQSAYRAKPSKAYTNYRKDNIARFDKTVYRSDVISDESLVNGFRHFGTDEYKNITENKGKITNIVGIGFYLIVHTEYSMFVFDRSPRLTQRSQLDIPDTFEVDYQEVMPSNEGFGGLKYKEESIVTKHGYIWFDRVNRIIFKYENGQAQILSSDINNFIKVLNIDTVRFAEDIIHNRVFVCIHTTGGDYLTLSYSFYSNTFISLHDYKFTDNYRTYNKSYMFDNSATNKAILYEFDDSAIADYKGLTLDTGEDTVFPMFPTYLASDNKNKSYVDIIFNEGYDAVKALNSLDYILNEIHNKLVFNIASEEELYRRFSGDTIIIYTDETNSGELDIHVPVASTNSKTDGAINAIELNDSISYKYPAFNKGKWTLNYFRNRITEAVSQSDITGFSDNRSLIYGKYFVLRFIFNNDRKIKFDSVNINIQVY